MAPLTLTEKYDDLVRCADQPLSSYNKLTNEDLEDVLSKTWPFIVESITYTPWPSAKTDSTMSTSLPIGEVQMKLERRLKIHFQLYSEAAKRYQQRFPNRRPIRQNRDFRNAMNATNPHLTDSGSLSFETNSTFSFDNEPKKDIPDFYVFCAPERGRQNDRQLLSVNVMKNRQEDYDRVTEYLVTTMRSSPYKMIVFKQALKECCQCGNYYLLENLCLAADISKENIYFDNNDSILHESIKLNNKQLTIELIRYKFNINVEGELGTPLVTAIHYNILWAVELLLKNDADLTRRHIDWPFLTLYEYCIQFAKIDIKLMIDKHIISLIQKHKYMTIRKLVDNGWTIHRSKRRYVPNVIQMK